MLDLPNIKIVFNSGISFSFSYNKKDCEKKELEDDITESDDLEKIVKDYFVVAQDNQSQLFYSSQSKSYRINFDTRIDKHQSYDILIPPPEFI
jgi:hypothetical protein